MKIYLSAFSVLVMLMLSAGVQPSVAQQATISIQLSQPDSQLLFAGSRIRQAATAKGIRAVQAASLGDAVAEETVIRIIMDSALSVQTAKNEQLKLPEFGWQCYAIRTKVTGRQTVLYVLAGDRTGAMYGGLDIAEAIRINILDKLVSSDHKPFMERRGIKFNIPLDLRTPSYTDPSDAAQQSIPDVWERSFWEAQLDEMAVNRYNVLSLWSLHPFPSLVKIPEFPDVALNDVWRTRERFDDGYSHTGVNFVRPHLLANVEVLKKMTIEQKIAFWKDVMQMAKNRGIDVYIFTWNIFTNGAEGKHGITNRQDNDTTIAYFRAAVRELVTTYPLLSGIGITAGESMDAKMQGEYANEKWLWRTYGEGIRDALKKEPGREFRLIHRFHQTSLNTIKDAFREYPGPFDLSLKYAIAHMYSIPDPPFVNDAMPLLSMQTKSWLTIRNDDIYSFRWANNDFARRFMKAIPEPGKIAGYYMGPDGYIWGHDYLTRGTMHPLVMQKQWYSFMLWGRLGYDPDLPDRLFFQTCKHNFHLFLFRDCMHPGLPHP